MDENKVISIQDLIFEVRDQKVMLDRDLADLYGVEVKALNQSVKRNIDRFPVDFMFQLTQDEWENLRSHFVTSSLHGGRRYAPFVFTEQGVSMLSSVINSKRAIEVNINIMRTFVKLRHYIFFQGDMNESKQNLQTPFVQIIELRKLLMLYIEKNDKRVNDIIIALNNLIEQPKKVKETKRIGFSTD